jgi:hypothetical protein
LGDKHRTPVFDDGRREIVEVRRGGRLWNVPWIEDINAKTCEMLYIAGNDGKVVFDGRRRDQSVRCI